ncbi:phosphopantetheine-binding protein [Chroogloeocystis siderophila 5.2 s.c.1]|uniref:Phosphopantetheine-binding protein n=1 Tax=Chroogloeocystis siderophila 5.2 s.c.1 TaxID=247279 RepID=A0A1U7HSD5_9CHRO|nr:phosphopantetheine-binding protein [Chroogloeocystis siderophila 5.2 s.c.1]
MHTTKENVRKIAPTAAEIQAWIVSYLADLLEINPDEIDTTIPFDRYGLDSAVVVGLTGDLEAWLDSKVDPTLIYDYPTIEDLTRHLAEELGAKM